ncbi:MAG TPA: C-GCAxxG-C-C family (seleno)protein [Bacillota bacterium]|nr:C-GCAxxG-C-C family (seleno)protein [Bacillota bacterium]
MLYDLIKNGYGQAQDFNCAEKILYGGNEAYKLGLNRETLKISAGFGGGMAIGSVCGALSASIMILGILFVQNNAHESSKIKDLTKELLSKYEEAMGEIDCTPLIKAHRTKEEKCNNVILKAAEILDSIVSRELGEAI